MSVVDVSARKDYTGDGGTTVFPFDWYIAEKAHLEVLANGVTLLLDSNYTVTGAGALAGGSVTILPAPAAGVKILLLRLQPVAQTSRYQQNEDLPSARIELDFDKAVMGLQQMRETLRRAAKFTKQSLLSEPVLPDGEVGKLLEWLTTTTLRNVTVASISPSSVTVPISIANGGTASATAAAARAALAVAGLADENTFTKRQHWAKGADVASAASLAPGTDGNYFHVTGTTGITSIVTQVAGSVLLLEFDGVLTITHHATNLILRSATDFTTAAGDTMILVSEGTGKWRELARGQAQQALVPLGHLGGLGVSNNAIDATNDLDIAVGEAVSDDALAVNRVLLNAGAMTKRLDAVWAAGTNAGGLAAADTLSGAKTLHAWIFRRTGGVDDYFFSTSLTPTVPDSGTKKRRIGSILWNGSTVLGFTQDGDEVLLNASILDVNITHPGTAAVLRTLTVPTGIKVTALFNFFVSNVATNYNVYFSSPDQTDEAPSITLAPLGQGGTTAATPGNYTLGVQRIRTNTAAQIRSRFSASGAGDPLRIATLGWIDRRGRG